MWHKPCRTFHPWCLCIKTRCLFNIKIPSYQYRKSHCGDKTILRPSYLHNGISYTGKKTSLYWIRAQPLIITDNMLCLEWWANSLAGWFMYPINGPLTRYVKLRVAHACAGNAGNVFPTHRLHRKPLVSNPGMHNGTWFTHVGIA